MVQVWITPPDREQMRWRIEVTDRGVRVWRLVDDSLLGTPRRDVRDVRQLGAWLVDRGIDPGDLEER